MNVSSTKLSASSSASSSPKQIVSRAFLLLSLGGFLIFTFGTLETVLAQNVESALAEETSENQKEAQVRTLIQALGSPSASKRTNAENTLMELGPEILPFLPESVRSPEARMRLNRIRVALERKIAEDSLEAGIVSLPEAVPTDEIPEKVEAQTRNTLEFSLPSKTVFTLPEAEQEVPFWVFLDAFCDEFHLAPQTLPSGKGVRLVSSLRSTPRSASKNPRIAYLKPFRLEPLKITSSILLGSNKPGTLLQLELTWEPRITPVFAYIQLSEAEFLDENGQSLGATLKLPSGEHEILIGQKELRALCEIPLSGVSIPPAARSMTLRGTLSAVACGTKKDFTFQGLENCLDRQFSPQTQRTAAVLVTFSSLRTEIVQPPHQENTEGKQNLNSVQYIIATLRYRYEETHEAMESHRTWIYENDAVLQKPDGSHLKSERSELLRQTPNEIAVDVYFPMNVTEEMNLRDWQLIFPRPGGIYEVESSFELQEIPIP